MDTETYLNFLKKWICIMSFANHSDITENIYKNLVILESIIKYVNF
jgi:hypothetical protein